MTITVFPGDANRDGHVDLTDLSIVLNNFGSCNRLDCRKLRRHSTVDLTDLSYVLNNFGASLANATIATATETPTTITQTTNPSTRSPRPTPRFHRIYHPHHAPGAHRTYRAHHSAHHHTNHRHRVDPTRRQQRHPRPSHNHDRHVARSSREASSEARTGFKETRSA